MGRGKKLALNEGTRGMPSAIAKADELVALNPDRYVLLQQLKNPANLAVHKQTTGPEVWNETSRSTHGWQSVER